MHAQLAEHITPFNDALQMPGRARCSTSRPTGRALADQMLTQQAAIIAYANDFELLTAICMPRFPLVFVIGSTASLRGGAGVSV